MFPLPRLLLVFCSIPSHPMNPVHHQVLRLRFCTWVRGDVGVSGGVGGVAKGLDLQATKIPPGILVACKSRPSATPPTSPPSSTPPVDQVPKATEEPDGAIFGHKVGRFSVTKLVDFRSQSWSIFGHKVGQFFVTSVSDPSLLVTNTR